MRAGVAIVSLVFDLPSAIWPDALARSEAQPDSIGSKRSWSEVEPAEWKLALIRVLGIGMALVGLPGLLVAE